MDDYGDLETMKVKVKLLGVFKQAQGDAKFNLELEKPESLRKIIQRLTEPSFRLRDLLIDPELNDPRPNAIILVNDREISLMEGLETIVKDGDEIVLIPVVHGG